MPFSQESQEKRTFLTTNSGSWHLTQPIIRPLTLFLRHAKLKPLAYKLTFQYADLDILGAPIIIAFAACLWQLSKQYEDDEALCSASGACERFASSTNFRVHQFTRRIDNPVCFLMLWGKTRCESSIPSPWMADSVKIQGFSRASQDSSPTCTRSLPTDVTVSNIHELT